MNPEPRAHTSIGRRGLEVTIATPWAMTGVFCALSVLGMMAAFAILVATVEITGSEPDFLAILDILFGRAWLWAGVAVLVLLIVSDRFSNDHYVIGTRTIERQFRNGRIVLNREIYPLDRVTDPAAVEEEGRWLLSWRSTRWPRERQHLSRQALSREEAEAVAERIRQWLAAPGTDEPAEEPPGPVAWLESAVSLVSSRFGLAIPLLIAAAALVLLAFAWQLYQEQETGGAAPTEELQLADGELQQILWVLDPSTTYAGSVARAQMVASIHFEVDGRPQTLWLSSRNTWSLSAIPNLLARVSEMLGAPEIQFSVPSGLMQRVPSGSSWPEWSDLVWGPGRADRPIPASAVEVLDALDDPYPYLALRLTASDRALPIAFPPGRPERAMPLSWFEAEQVARAGVSLVALVPTVLVALLLLFATLPRVIVRARHRRWIATCCVALLVLALPWWAAHAEKVPGWLGVDEAVLDWMADLLRVHGDEQGHLFFTRTTDPFLTDPVLEWTPERSAAFPLLDALRIIADPPAVPLPSIEHARQYMIDRATAVFAAMSDAELKRFATDYGSANHHQRHGALHQEVVVPAYCTQRPRLGTGFFLYQPFIDLHFPCEEIDRATGS